MSRTRRGFTLVELLMVIVVIGILSTLLVSGGMYVITSSREAATKSTLRIVNQIIKDRQMAYWESVKQHAHGDYGVRASQFKKMIGDADELGELRVKAIWDPIRARIEAQAGVPTDPMWNERLAHTMLHIEMERLFFPQTWDEADFMLFMGGKNPISSDPASETENSEVLFWMLSEKTVVGTMEVDSDWIKPSMLADKDGDGRKELIDAWGNPIRFYRWPTRILRPNGLPADYKPRQTVDMSGMVIEAQNVPEPTPGDFKLAEMLLKSASDATADPRDPLMLQVNNRVSDAEINALNTSASVSQMEQEYYLPNTYHSPIVISPGQDGKHGLLNPVSKADFGYWGKVATAADAFDDITDR